MDAQVARILDANINRASEGLRVCEEYARFILDNAALVQKLKNMRHLLREACDSFESTLPSGALLAARDTAGDCGTGATTEQENSRATSSSVATASIKRLQEALRSLEEYGKTVSPKAAEICQNLRYTSYDLEAILAANPERRKMLKDAKLYVLVTESLSSTDAITATREAVAGGADIIQMREKDLEDGAFYEQAQKMQQICKTGGALFLINDRPHIAALADADGIHSGQGDLPVNLVRRIIGDDRIIGKSTSSPEYADKAFDDGADYIGVGPVYPTNTKQHRSAVGLEYVKWVAENSKLPYFCIGSINRDTVGGVLDAGAKAVAVCTAIINAKDIAAETAWFKEQVASRH